MKRIKFCQLETESHDTSECDIIGGHMLQLTASKEGGECRRCQLAGFSKDNSPFHRRKKVVAIKTDGNDTIDMWLSVATSHMLQKRGGESTLG